jgi:hypothetical protein
MSLEEKGSIGFGFGMGIIEDSDPAGSLKLEQMDKKRHLGILTFFYFTFTP